MACCHCHWRLTTRLSICQFMPFYPPEDKAYVSPLVLSGEDRKQPATPRNPHKEQSTTQTEDTCKKQYGAIASDTDSNSDEPTQMKRPPYKAKSSKATPKLECPPPPPTPSLSAPISLLMPRCHPYSQAQVISPARLRKVRPCLGLAPLHRCVPV